MDEQEYYNAIINILNRLELNWVAEQVEEQIRIGKTEITEISEPRQAALPGFPVSHSRSISKRTERFSITTRYTSKERLVLLIDAVEQVLNSTLMAKDTLDFFRNQYSIQEIVFYSDEENNDNNDNHINLNFNVIPHISNEVATAKALLNNLRGQLDAD